MQRDYLVTNHEQSSVSIIIAYVIVWSSTLLFSFLLYNFVLAVIFASWRCLQEVYGRRNSFDAANIGNPQVRQ